MTNPYELVFSFEAYLDLEQSRNWYNAKSRKLAIQFVQEVNLCIQHIALHPHHFQRRKKEIRSCPLDKFPYVIHYIDKKETIIVIGVFHTSQRPRNSSI